MLYGYCAATLASDTIEYLALTATDATSTHALATNTRQGMTDEAEPGALGTRILRFGSASSDPPDDEGDEDTRDDHNGKGLDLFDGRLKSGLEAEILLSRVETRALRRSQQRGEGAEEDLEPSAEPGLKFEAEIELVGNWRKSLALGQRPRDDVRETGQEISLGLSYRPSEKLLVFGEIKFLAEQVVFDDDSPRISEEAVERGETWILFNRISDSGYSLQLGRQNFIEPRLWWWDEDLDAVRGYYAGDSWRLYVAIAEELARTSSRELIDPVDEDVRRLFGLLNWSLSKRFNLSAFYLGQRDNSNTPGVDSVVKTVSEDQSDADLDWFGLRATGDISLSRGGTLRYRADSAVIYGDETLLQFEDDTPVTSLVDSKQKQSVSGWALDLGLNWILPLPQKPALKVFYAYGSGDKNFDDDTDRTFRQTGLQDQDDEFRDYGELLRPELSNLRITTVAIALPVHVGTRLTLGYHRFRQVYAVPFLREARIDIEPAGESRDIGQEISLFLEIRKWEDVEIDLIAATFKAGNAYGAAEGERSSKLFFKLIYEF